MITALTGIHLSSCRLIAKAGVRLVGDYETILRRQEQEEAQRALQVIYKFMVSIVLLSMM